MGLFIVPRSEGPGLVVVGSFDLSESLSGHSRPVLLYLPSLGAVSSRERDIVPSHVQL
jgi:hypothetical protein